MSTLADLENEQVGHQLLNSMDKFENPVPEMATTCQQDMPEVRSAQNYDCYSNKDTMKDIELLENSHTSNLFSKTQ